jgi:ABC-type amino acid transport substrate-binding protein/tRNA A-37 threonylcarbamoyl transferase component Bud32
VDRVCDAFEDEWRAGRRPAVEEFLGRVAEADRPALFAELLRADIHYRKARGECPAAGDYLGRFPGYEEVVAAAFAPAPTADPPENVTGDTVPAAPREAPRPAVPGYEILGELGRGGMGVVYKARDEKLDRPVALKMVLGGAHVGPERLARFLSEARATARVRHPHIVQILKIGEADGLPYLELELVGGGSLADRLDGTPRPPREAARLVEQLARAVAYAHDRNIVHRDLKPANVLLTESGEPKITDFGLAKLTDAAGPTVTGAVYGTPSYMAPEQARGDAKKVGPAADLYALGVILFELLTGRVPFAADSTMALLRKVEREPPPPPRSLCRGVPRDLEAICLRCLEKDPADRYPSADALADDLTAYLAGKSPAHARTVGPLGRLWRRSRRRPVVALVALAAIVAGAVAGLMLLSDDSLRRVQRPGKLVVGLDPNCPPYAFQKDGRLTGLDVELATELARRLGVRAEFVERYWDWPGMVQQLDERKFDVLISFVSITEERERQVAFVKYHDDPLVFAARRGAPIRTREDLAGKVVVVQEGTIAHEAARRLQAEGVGFTEIVTLRSTPEPFDAVGRKRADVSLDHRLIANHHAPERGLEVFPFPNDLDPALARQEIGVALRRDARALRMAVEKAVGQMRQDGSLDAILSRWDGR